jgi:hypothetical protein
MAMHARVRAEQGRLREADEAFRRTLRLLAEEGYINNLYRKIEAHSRTQALARARELNLL